MNEELGLKTINYLIYFFPFRYVDRTKFHKINEIDNTNLDIQIIGFVKSIEEHGFGRKKRLLILFSDNENEIELVFFKKIIWIKKLIKLQQNMSFCKLFNGHTLSFTEMELVDDVNFKM